MGLTVTMLPLAVAVSANSFHNMSVPHKWSCDIAIIRFHYSACGDIHPVLYTHNNGYAKSDLN
jgi:hypothetical protein